MTETQNININSATTFESFPWSFLNDSKQNLLNDISDCASYITPKITNTVTGLINFGMAVGNFVCQSQKLVRVATFVFLPQVLNATLQSNYSKGSYSLNDTLSLNDLEQSDGGLQLVGTSQSGSVIESFKFDGMGDITQYQQLAVSSGSLLVSGVKVFNGDSYFAGKYKLDGFGQPYRAAFSNPNSSSEFWLLDDSIGSSSASSFSISATGFQVTTSIYQNGNFQCGFYRSGTFHVFSNPNTNLYCPSSSGDFLQLTSDTQDVSFLRLDGNDTVIGQYRLESSGGEQVQILQTATEGNLMLTTALVNDNHTMILTQYETQSIFAFSVNGTIGSFSLSAGTAYATVIHPNGNGFEVTFNNTGIISQTQLPGDSWSQSQMVQSSGNDGIDLVTVNNGTELTRIHSDNISNPQSFSNCPQLPNSELQITVVETLSWQNDSMVAVSNMSIILHAVPFNVNQRAILNQQIECMGQFNNSNDLGLTSTTPVPTVQTSTTTSMFPLLTTPSPTLFIITTTLLTSSTYFEQPPNTTLEVEFGGNGGGFPLVPVIVASAVVSVCGIALCIFICHKCRVSKVEADWGNVYPKEGSIQRNLTIEPSNVEIIYNESKDKQDIDSNDIVVNTDVKEQKQIELVSSNDDKKKTEDKKNSSLQPNQFQLNDDTILTEKMTRRPTDDGEFFSKDLLLSINIIEDEIINDIDNNDEGEGFDTGGKNDDSIS